MVFGGSDWLEKRKIRRLLDRGKLDEAVNYLEGKDKDREAAQLLADHGNPVRAANLLTALGDYAGAVSAALAAGQTEWAAQLAERGGDLRRAARLYERQREFPRAIKLYMETRDLERVAALASGKIEDVNLLKKAADYLEKHGEWQGALDCFRKGNWHKDVGRVLASRGNLGEAISMFEQHDCFEEAAAIYSGQREHRRAAYLLMKAGQVVPAMAELLKDGDHLAVARMYRRLDDSAAALEVLNGIEPDSKQFRDGMLMASAILEEHSRFREAIAPLEQLLKRFGFAVDRPDVLYRMVDLQIYIGDLVGAVDVLERARRAGVKTPTIDEQLMLLKDSPGEQLLEPPIGNGEAEPAPRRKSPTTTIGFPRSDRYKLVRQLARGGHGILFLVRDLQEDREVVLKLLRSESLPSQVSRDYFMREARTALSLDHPNIVKIFDYGEIQGRPFIAMEYVDGISLAEVEDPPARVLTMNQKTAICLQLCDALAYAHSKNVIHRDIKLDNVMVDRRWQVKLMDFGLAKCLDEDPSRSMFIVGTPNYMSPEQIAGDFLDHRTDIYSLGVFMYRMYTGRLPFEDKDVLQKHRTTAPVNPKSVHQDLPDVVVETILRCLEKKRQDRIQTVADVAARLRQTLG